MAGGTDYEIFNLMVYKNRLYVMGEITEAGGISASYIAEWDGSKWCSIDNTIDNSITTSCVYKDSLYIGGGFWTIDGDSISYIAEWTGGDYTVNCSQPTGISDVKAESEAVNVYPNPSNGEFMLSCHSKGNKESTIQVYNELGQQVYSANYPLPTANYSLDLSAQPNGIYFYRITTTDGTLIGNGKLIIQK